MGRSSPALVLAAAAIMMATFAAASSGGIDYGEEDLSSEEALWGLYERWSAEYNVKRQGDQKGRRFNIFKQKARYIHDFNKQGNAGYTLGLNLFSDMTNDEINEISTCDSEPDVTQAATHHHGGNPEDDVVEAPDYVDWRLLGVVSDPKDQGTSCGSCWAFAATGAIESLHAINNDHQLLSLSVQQLVDCDERSGGCESGNAGNAFQYVTDSGGLALDSDYPYRGAQGTCNDANIFRVVTIHGFGRVNPNSELDLMKAVARQPVYVSVDASDLEFKHYKEDIYRGPCGSKTSHAMLLVGYNFDDLGEEEDHHWILKNSWGAWGEQGYMRLYRRSNFTSGPCGLFTRPVYPLQ